MNDTHIDQTLSNLFWLFLLKIFIRRSDEQCIEIIIIIDICNSTDYFLWTTPSKRMFLCCCTFVSCFRFLESFKVFSLFGCNRAFSRRNRNRSLFDSTKKNRPDPKMSSILDVTEKQRGILIVSLIMKKNRSLFLTLSSQTQTPKLKIDNPYYPANFSLLSYTIFTFKTFHRWSWLGWLSEIKTNDHFNSNEMPFYWV